MLCSCCTLLPDFSIVLLLQYYSKAYCWGLQQRRDFDYQSISTMEADLTR